MNKSQVLQKLRRLLAEPQWWVLAIWLVEVSALQFSTLGYDYTAPFSKRLISANWRGLLDVLLLGSAVLLLPRPILVLVWIAEFFLGQTAWVYHDVFGRALSWSTLSAQLHEGAQGAGFDWDYVLNPSGVLLLLALGAKIAIVAKKGDRFAPRRTWGACLLGIYLLVAVVGVTRVDPLSKLRRFGTVDRMGATHGYILTWLGEAYYLAPETLLAEALERAKLTDSSLMEKWGPLPVSSATNILIVQTESLDWRVLGQEFAEAPLVPFLQTLRDSSLLFRTQAVHENGSADADFIWLTGNLPSPRIVTYKLRGYPYTESLAARAHAVGFDTAFVHGNSGDFFDRRIAVAQMGFDRTLFTEELYPIGLAPSIWGIDDDVVFDYIAQQINGAQTPQLFYFVTLTSHQPFVYLPTAKASVQVDKTDMTQRYWQAIRYVDESLASLYAKLPDGTLLIVFGDHRAIAKYSPTQKDYDIEGEYVPTFIAQKGHNLREQFGQNASYDESHVHAIASWVHQSLAQAKR